MQHFEQRWQTLAERARQAPGRDEAAPFGFAGRVVALGSQPQPNGLEGLWVRLSLPVLAGALTVLIVCSALEVPHMRDARPLEPGVENTVAQIVWAL